jgi:alkaline phosphatase
MSFSRRTALSMGAAGIVAGSLSLPNLISAQSDFKLGERKWRGRRPKNIIFCVADGMATQMVAMSDYYQQLVNGRTSYWSELLQRDDIHSGWQDTRSLSSIVTDSAAAASTWGSGRKIWNGQLNMFPDGTELRTLASIMIENGVKVGLVTTTTITHATPAGFAINCQSRELEGLIAEKYLKSGVSVLMGGGNKFFAADKRKDNRDLYGDFAKAGYKVVRDRKSISGLKADKILGIFSDSHLPFSVDRDHNAKLTEEVPTLAEMTQVAIENLRGNKNGFLLQIEGGKVDHGCHANDIAAALFDQIAFEEAVKVAIEFAQKDKDTLVIITSDHACGGPSLNGAGNEYFDTTSGLVSISKHMGSYSLVTEQMGKTPSVDLVKDLFLVAYGYKLGSQEAGLIADTVAGKKPLGFLNLQNSVNSVMALVMQNHTKVGFTSNNHTHEHVMVAAYGPGNQHVQGLTYNIEFFDMMLAAKGLKWSNPTMSFADAVKAMEKLKANYDPEIHAMYANHEDDECSCHTFG